MFVRTVLSIYIMLY